MKKIPILILMCSLPLFAQQNNLPKLLNLNEDTRSSFNNSDLNISSQELYQVQSQKSPGVAIIYSLLLPGMGELYAGSYSSGKYFTIAEGALWATFIGFNSYGGWQKDSYQSFAVSNAGITASSKDDDYYANIGLYLSIDEYNNSKALERDYSAMYNEKGFYWNWTSQDRKTYRNMWLSSEHAYNNIRFIVGAMILNRVISAINAVRLVSKYNKNLEQNMGWNLSVGVTNQTNIPAGLTVNFQTQF